MNGQITITAGQLEASSLPMECPVLALLPSLAKISADHERLQKVSLGEIADGVSRTLSTAAISDADDAELAIRDRLTTLRARSFEGAAGQLGELLVRISYIEDEPFGEGATPSHFRAARRLIFSVLHMIEEAINFEVNTIAGKEFVNRVLDPWKSLEERKAMLKDPNPSEDLEHLIDRHRAAETAFGDALVDDEECRTDVSDPDTDRLLEARALEKTARAQLLTWRPSTLAEGAERLRYLLRDKSGPWAKTVPNVDELDTLFASMMEAQ